MWSIGLGRKVIHSSVFPLEFFTQAAAVLVWISRNTAFKEKNLDYYLLLLGISSAGRCGRILQSPVKQLEMVTIAR